MIEDGSLNRNRGGQGGSGARKSRKVGVPLVVDLMAIAFLGRGSEETPVLNQDLCIAVPQLLE
jgi:hypothetical protein